MTDSQQLPDSEAVEAARIAVRDKWGDGCVRNCMVERADSRHSCTCHAMASLVVDSLSSRVETAREEMKEECAKKAQAHLEDWAADLTATRDQYIDAQRTGRFNDRAISRDLARAFATSFRQRSEAVSESAEHTATAIRSLSSLSVKGKARDA